MPEYCAACYTRKIYCRKCKTDHCQCSWNRHPVPLDPDFRRDPKTSQYCVRCQKDIADATKAIRVTVNWDKWTVTRGGKELLGKDCAKKIGLPA